ncbi:cartilage intermediate layer protein 2 [Nothobranchius furzeri]|uniref:cartilage intermediate layer protein 2 n=1 Tax=Nothobranchius furzeri TaxID=105023 RepID=UPI002403D6B7|nr:cartilage intermediate layer protein 1-like [Nothobranchius furzeri]
MTKLMVLSVVAALLLVHVKPSKGGIVPPICKTDWYDRDNPDGQGDYEDLRHLRREYPGQICPNPSRIEAVTVIGNIPAEDTGRIFKAYNTEVGFICRNEDQQFGRCKDYKVRFTCPCP